MNHNATRKPLLASILMLLGLTPLGAQAAPPDAGNILQDNLRETPYQPQAPSVPLDLKGTPLESHKKGGMQVRITRIELSGHSVFDEATLQAVVADALNIEQDMAGLKAIANRLTRYYRERGYPFAHAILPQQTVSNGVLKITLFEGRYGQVRASGDDPLAAPTQPWLDALQTGEVIATGPLERSILLLRDLPGINITPVISPGEVVGTGDLDVEVNPGKKLRTTLGVDNHGSKSSGRGRVHAAMQANRMLTLGDELSVTALYSEEDLWLGRVAYAMPLGHNGLRGEIAYARTEYNLGEPFAGFTGTADIRRAQLSYPLIRSQQTNLSALLTYRHKKLDDQLNDTSYQKRESDSGSLGMQFDQRSDSGTHYGEVSLTSGHISNNAEGATEGSFNYLNLNLSRLQNLPGKFSFLGNLQLQWADTSLDSSESKSLGGANGVRAYPQGEISGSRVWLISTEVRYQVSATLAPYLFFDHGQREEYKVETSEQRAGGGIGLRYQREGLSVDAVVAVQSSGEASTEKDQDDTRFCLQALYQF